MKLTERKQGATLLATLLLICTLAASKAEAIVLLDVGANTGAGSGGELIAPGDAVAVSFSLDQGYTNVSISAEIYCILSGCEGAVILMENDIGPLATLANFVDEVAFNDATTIDPLFSGLTLGPGVYFLMVENTEPEDTDIRNIEWLGEDPFVEAQRTLAAGVTHNFDLRHDDAGGPTYEAFNSEFLTILGTGALQFVVTGDLEEDTGSGPGSGGSTPAPAPSALWLLASGLLLLRRARTATANQT